MAFRGHYEKKITWMKNDLMIRNNQIAATSCTISSLIEHNMKKGKKNNNTIEISSLRMFEIKRKERCERRRK